MTAVAGAVTSAWGAPACVMTSQEFQAEGVAPTGGMTVTVVVQVASDERLLPGAPVHLIVDPADVHLFDADSGKPQWTYYSTPPPGTPGSIAGGATGGGGSGVGAPPPRLWSAVP